MKRKVAMTVLSVWVVFVGTSTVSAAVKTIEAGPGIAWQPNALTATVGDVVEWKMGPGSGLHTHGARITNWAAVQALVEVETVAGQQPFDATIGRNPMASNTDGQVLVRLKVKSAPAAPAEITYNCIVHGAAMSGKVSIAAAAVAVKTIEAGPGIAWQPNALTATVGDVVEWKMGPGSGVDTHGVRITNWAAVQALVEVETVAGQQPFDATIGRNPMASNTDGQVLVRLKVKSAPAAPAEITYNCIVHGAAMIGKVSIAAAAVAVKTIEAGPGIVWRPNDIGVSVGDEVEWKLGAGTHGVRITNWAAVMDHVEVEMVAGQQPFNSTTGRNDNSTNTAGQVLLRLKVNSVPAAAAEITYNCIVHGVAMIGKVSIAAAVDGTNGGPDKASLEKVQEFFAKFGAGDIPGVLNTMSEEIEWFIPGPSTIPYAGQRNGKEQVGMFFGTFSDAVEVQEFKPRVFISQKNQVVVLGHEVLKVKTTSNVVKNEWAMVFTIDSTQITRFRSYEDTAALVAAFGKCGLPGM